MKKKCAALLLALLTVLSLAGCSAEGAVYVQSVEKLSGLGGIAPGDRFAGIVVSENVSEIQRDRDKTILELMVKAGDDVVLGQPLFSYDTEELQLTLEKQKLELEQLLATIENYKQQITQLEKERKTVRESKKLQYTIEIQSLQVDLKEAELKIKPKETEIAKSESLLENSVVFSPVAGRIQSVSENGTDNYGNPLPYITIQQVGSYRIKGTLGELQRGGLIEGTRLKIVSRTSEDIYWTGAVTLVDYENPSQGNQNDMYYGSSPDEMSSSSRYPFYVQLDSTDGLILGQHVYMTLDTGEEEEPGLNIGSAFFCYNEDGTMYVWAEKEGQLEKRAVTVGEYNPMNDTYPVLSGLTAADYIAFPDASVCVEGAPTTHSQPAETLPPEGEVA